MQQVGFPSGSGGGGFGRGTEVQDGGQGAGEEGGGGVAVAVHGPTPGITSTRMTRMKRGVAGWGINQKPHEGIPVLWQLLWKQCIFISSVHGTDGYRGTGIGFRMYGVF